MPVPLSSMETLDRKTIGLYGPSGAGKTFLTSSHPGKKLYVDFDGKLGGVPKERHPSIEVEQFIFTSATQSASMFEKFMAFWKRCKKSSFTLSDGSKPDLIILDSFTPLDIACLNFYMLDDGKDPETDKPTLPIYGNQGSYYNSFFAGMNGFKCDVVIIFHEFYRTDDKGLVEGIQPLVTGSKILNKIPAMLQELWYLENVKGTRTLSYKNHKKAYCNTISLKGNGKIIDPTWEKIMKETK